MILISLTLNYAYLFDSQITVIRIGGFAFGIGCVGEGVYEGSRALRLWK